MTQAILISIFVRWVGMAVRFGTGMGLDVPVIRQWKIDNGQKMENGELSRGMLFVVFEFLF